MIGSICRGSEGILFLLSLICVGFGQPAWHPGIAALAAALGYTPLFYLLCQITSPMRRLGVGTLWFTLVQLIQLSWLLSHPYAYIYLPYFLFSLIWGAQFGLLALFITPSVALSTSSILAISGGWSLLEWARLFFLSGFTFNPAGLALTSHPYSLQMASLMGVYGLSFWTMLSNLFLLKALLLKGKWSPKLMWMLLIFFPYLYGFLQIEYHRAGMETSPKLTAVLVQPAFPAEEKLNIKDRQLFLSLVFQEWEQMLQITKKHRGEKHDLLLFPEAVVPYGAYSFVYPYEKVLEVFKLVYGEKILEELPAPLFPLAHREEEQVWVNNGYWAQAIANLFQTSVVIGLEDAEYGEQGRVEYYSAAFHLLPQSTPELLPPMERYKKQVLVPMGEYIPFDWLQNLARQYGITGSYTPGGECTLFSNDKWLFGPTICYEETFGHLMRQNRAKGADILLNLTSDVWYPNSRLIFQHFDLARLRTVENGIPLLRACNTGVTAAIDSLGNTISYLEGEDGSIETLADSLKVSVPTYRYFTLYSLYGDSLVVLLSVSSIAFSAMSGYRREIKRREQKK